MRMPTFSRQSNMTTEDERPTVVSTGTTPVRERTDPPPPPPRSTVAPPSEETTKEFKIDDRAATTRDAVVDERAAANRDANVDLKKVKPEPVVEEAPVVAGPKPRASLLATLGLILSVAGVLLVLSGPLLGWGIGVAALALVLSLCGIHATGRRHVAGKTDALIGMVLSLGAIVIGVLALTGSLAWAGTDIPAVSNLREWLDSQFANRF
jgi:hypothetical protein